MPENIVRNPIPTFILALFFFFDQTFILALETFFSALLCPNSNSGVKCYGRENVVIHEFC